MSYNEIFLVISKTKWNTQEQINVVFERLRKVSNDMRSSELPYKTNPLLFTCLLQHQLQPTLFPKQLYTGCPKQQQKEISKLGKITYSTDIHAKF